MKYPISYINTLPWTIKYVTPDLEIITIPVMPRYTLRASRTDTIVSRWESGSKYYLNRKNKAIVKSLPPPNKINQFIICTEATSDSVHRDNIIIPCDFYTGICTGKKDTDKITIVVQKFKHKVQVQENNYCLYTIFKTFFKF